MPGFSTQRMMQSAVMGAALGAGGVIVGTFMQVGRMPPASQITGAAAVCAIMPT